MSLKEVYLKPTYDSDEEDLVESFYIPALSHSIKYKRLAGFFSSSSLAAASQGIASFVKNNGKMQLITGVKLKKHDVEEICKAIKNPEEVISSILIKDLACIEDEIIKNHVRALGWMIAKNFLEIKLAILTDEKNIPLDEDTVENLGIFHLKIGLFEDSEGNVVSFSGSVNESATGWKENIEEFKVFRSWNEDELKYLKSDYEKFDKYWFGQATKIKIIDVPTAVKQKLIDLAPTNFDSLKFIKPLKKIPELKDYQLEAIEKWLNNNKNGIFEMATGTGKTFVALGCANEIKKNNKFVIVVVCPYNNLIFDPWIKRLNEFRFKNIIDVFGSFSSWKDKLMDNILDFNNGISENLVVVTNYDTFSNKNFIDMIEKIKKPVLLIADEVHSVGTLERLNGLVDKYTYRIGLSATPRRWLDDEGTDRIYQYFDKTVYEFPLALAIEKGYLTPYEYHPHFVELDDEEFERYEKISKKIAIQYYKSKNVNEKKQYYNLLCIQRSNIIKNAKNKILKFEEILNSNENLDHCLVYCISKKQIRIIQDLLDKHDIISHKFTGDESAIKRGDLLKHFDKGLYNVLVAIKCLDEGVDIESTKMAIILASSGNPKEYIQRRGRVLRKSLGKSKAIIHDIIVVPTLTGEISPEVLDLEKKIIKTEFKRYNEFVSLASNHVDAFIKAYPIIKKYQINLD